jgi:hypothetical protein
MYSFSKQEKKNIQSKSMQSIANKKQVYKKISQRAK